MSPEHQGQWNWRRMYQVLWQSLGKLHRMRNGMTVCITWWWRGTPARGPGTQWPTAFSTTSLQPVISCQAESTSSVSMLKMTWDSLPIQNRLSGLFLRRKVCNNGLLSAYWDTTWVNVLFCKLWLLFIVRGMYNNLKIYHLKEWASSMLSCTLLHLPLEGAYFMCSNVAPHS